MALNEVALLSVPVSVVRPNDGAVRERGIGYRVIGEVALRCIRTRKTVGDLVMVSVRNVASTTLSQLLSLQNMP